MQTLTHRTCACLVDDGLFFFDIELDELHRIACGHSFSAAAITATFGGSNGLRKCPAAGCNKQFSLAHCKPDKDLAKKVKAYKRRMERNREDSDAEEVVD